MTSLHEHPDGYTGPDGFTNGEIVRYVVEGPIVGQQPGVVVIGLGQGEAIAVSRLDLVQRVAPANWPPQLSDVWGNSSGARWWAIEAHRSHPTRTEIALMDNVGNDHDPADALKDYGPLTLVWREQQDGGDDA